jgi:hypothetical protein
MPRPTLAQLCYGTLTVISATVLLLFVSDTDSLPGITVLVVFALTLGTLATSLSVANRALRNGTRPAPRAANLRGGIRRGEPGRVR